MARVKYTGSTSTVQLQPAQVRNKTQTESEEVSRLKLEESLVLQQQQSLEMVQIMLHVSFGTLFYLREFLPLGCFEDRDLKQAQREQRYSYDDFIHGKTHHETPESSQELAFGKGKKGQPLKVIIRSSDPKADMILDLLEYGIFEALSKNFLDAIQLTILVDENEPQNVLESYTFSFKYTGARGDVNSRLESLSLDPVGCVADMKSAQTARTGMEMIVRRLITLSAFLPTLPNKRNLGINLFYTDDCPSDYEPPGFTRSTDDVIKYPLNENWKKESQSCGTMDSGCHTVGLKVTSLKWTGPDPEGSEAPPKIPEQIEYRDRMKREAEIERVDGENYPCILLSRGGSFQEATQDIAERKKLQMMIPTQVSSHPDSDLIPTQPIKDMAAGVDAGTTVQNTEHEMRLCEKKRLQIQELLRFQNLGLAGITNNQDNWMVKCQCGWDGEEPAMITCSFCKTRQHLLCYGFTGPDDPRLSKTHACYQCLLEPDETQLLRELHTLVLLRRALKIIIDEGFPNKTSIFTQKLHCNGQTVIQISDLLRKHKFIQSTPGSKSKGFLQKGLPKFVVSSAGDTRERMQREILDPLAKIQHHYNDMPQFSESIIKAKPTTDGPSTSQSAAFSAKGYYMENHATQGSNYGTSETSESPARKRKQIPEKGYDPSYCQDQPNHPSGRGLSNGTCPMASQIQPVTPSKRLRSDENRMRRSDRKKRKISNYKQLIYVGAGSSGDESG